MKPIYVLFAAFSFYFTALYAQSTKIISLPWKKISEASAPSIQTPRIQANNAGYFSLNTQGLIDAFHGITYREGQRNGFVAEVQFPYPDGTLHT